MKRILVILVMLLLLPCLSVNAQKPLPEAGAAQDTLYRNPGQGKVASALGLGDILVGSAELGMRIRTSTAGPNSMLSGLHVKYLRI